MQVFVLLNEKDSNRGKFVKRAFQDVESMLKQNITMKT